MHCVVAKPSRDEELATRQIELQLTDEDRELIESCRAKGPHQAREINRANVDVFADDGDGETRCFLGPVQTGSLSWAAWEW